MHFLNLLFLSLIGITFAEDAAAKNENQSYALANSNTRIITGGTPVADIRDFPYQASLQLVATYTHLCSASLIDDQNLLTSAYCLHIYSATGSELRQADTLQVVLGSTKIGDVNNNNLVTKPLKYIFIHEGWSAVDFTNDIAVIRIDGAIEFTPYVRSINFATTSPPAGISCISSGWSYIASSEFDTDLRQVTFTKYLKAVCSVTIGTVGDDQFCGDSQSDCKGELGSPVRCNGFQAGIASFLTCNSNTGPMTDVAYHKDWIQTQLERSGSNTLLQSIYLISFCIYACLYAYKIL